MQTLEDVILDPVAAAEFSGAFQRSGPRLVTAVLVAPIDRLSYETLCNLDEFVALALRRRSWLPSTDFLLLWTRIVETEMPKAGCSNLVSPRALKWRDRSRSSLREFQLALKQYRWRSFDTADRPIQVALAESGARR